MARKICGESRLTVGARTVRLRLDIGTMMDLEDHFGMGLVPFLAERLPEFRIKDLAVLFAAMTGGDFTDERVQTGLIFRPDASPCYGSGLPHW